MININKLTEICNTYGVEVIDETRNNYIKSIVPYSKSCAEVTTCGGGSGYIEIDELLSRLKTVKKNNLYPCEIDIPIYKHYRKDLGIGLIEEDGAVSRGFSVPISCVSKEFQQLIIR